MVIPGGWVGVGSEGCGGDVSSSAWTEFATLLLYTVRGSLITTHELLPWQQAFGHSMALMSFTEAQYSSLGKTATQ